MSKRAPKPETIKVNAKAFRDLVEFSTHARAWLMERAPGAYIQMRQQLGLGDFLDTIDMARLELKRRAAT